MEHHPHQPAELREMLEGNLERTFAADPFEQMGGYVKRCRGLTLYVKAENPHRIERLLVDGDEARDERTSPVAFVTSQGVPPRFGRSRRNLEVRALDALRRHLERTRPLRAPERRSVIAI